MTDQPTTTTTTTAALATVEPIAAAIPSTWDASWRLAQRIAATPFVPGALRGRPESVLACVLYGNELGLGPMQSLSSIHVIDGRPAAAPELMRALIARAGHRIDVRESTDDRVTLAGRRADTGAEAVVTWSMADAQRAKLAGKGAWATYPRAMLLARATSELARMLFADVIAGLSYTPEEVASINGTAWEQIDPPTGEIIDPEPDNADATFERLRTVAGTAAAEELRVLAEHQGRRLSANEFRSHPKWRQLVHDRLDEILASDSPADDPDIADADIVGPEEDAR